MLTGVILLLLCGFAYCEEQYHCPDEVKRFSADSTGESYYECTEVGKPATKRKCEDGTLYWPAKEECVKADVGQADTSIENGPEGLQQHKRTEPRRNDLKQYTTAVLGRGVMLGCVFDAARNMIYPADSPWTRETVLKKRVVKNAYASDVDFFDAQTTFDRLTNMNVEAHIKLEFMGGLIKVEGSAAFAADTVKSLNTVAFAMKAHYVTRMEFLPTSTPKDFDKICDLREITHVVTGLTYGMDAYFAFKKSVKRDESRKDVSGSLKIAVHSIPMVKIDGEGKLNISESMKKRIAGIDVKLRGDFVLDVQPTTFEESVKVFKELSSHLGKPPDYTKASAMKMTLTPITRFCGKSEAILIAISKSLVNRVSKMLSKIEEMSLAIKTLKTYDAVTSYLPLQNVLGLLSTGLSELDLKLKGKLQTILPKIKGGGAQSSEADLVALLSTYDRDPLHDAKLNPFLKTRKREVMLLDFILKPETFKGTKVVKVSYENADDEQMLFSKDIVLMLRFNLLAGTTAVKHFLAGEAVDESGSWFNNDKEVSNMGKVFKLFMDFAKANEASKNSGFLLVVSNTKEQHIEVKAQNNGEIVSTHFNIPATPPKMAVTSNDFAAVTFRVERPTKNEWITGFTLKYWKFAKEKSAVETHFTFKASNSYEITDLAPNDVYLFSLKWRTIMGDSLYSPGSSPVLTKATSMPSNLKQSAVSSKSFTVRWEQPLHVGNGVQIQDYDVIVTQGGKMVKKRLTGGARTILIADLEPATKYSISAQAVTKAPHVNGSKEQDGFARSAKAQLDVVTSPDHPSQPNLVSISYHTAEITWTPPSKVAVGATIQEYLVQYVILNNKGDQSIGFSNMIQSSKTKTSIILKQLVQGSTYGINVKVVTSLGTSDYSPILMVKTRFLETELDKLNGSLKNQIKHSVDVSTSTLKQSIANQGQKFTTITDNIKQSIVHTTTTLKSNVADVDTKVTGVKSTLENQINNLNREITSKTAAVNNRIADGNTKITKLQEHHSCPTAIYIGESSPGAAEYWDVKDHFSMSRCCEYCSGRRSKEGAIWNAFFYIPTGQWPNRCVCTKNGSAFQKSGGAFGFKFA